MSKLPEGAFGMLLYDSLSKLLESAYAFGMLLYDFKSKLHGGAYAFGMLLYV